MFIRVSVYFQKSCIIYKSRVRLDTHHSGGVSREYSREYEYGYHWVRNVSMSMANTAIVLHQWKSFFDSWGCFNNLVGDYGNIIKKMWLQQFENKPIRLFTSWSQDQFYQYFNQYIMIVSGAKLALGRCNCFAAARTTTLSTTTWKPKKRGNANTSPCCFHIGPSKFICGTFTITLRILRMGLITKRTVTSY